MGFEVSCYEGVATLYTIIYDLRAMRPSTIASKTDAKVTGSSSSFKIRKGSAKSTQKGGTGRFSAAATFARREPCLDSFLIGSGIIYYEIEKSEKYDDSDETADSDLAVVKTRR
ncbi:hypothetical protein PIB30_094979 [Stylosanthes scabra]|uniref:Uncharacterized protein n=1 Tax=Stylosanthes scabra TaxID=79078 RepID=A0ABU6ZUC1_9FABA|nr:hypothetical protein [Stylosanthes scabra]